MQELKLYDPTNQRLIAEIVEKVESLTLAQEIPSAGASGYNPDEASTCLVFDSLAEAVAYCEAKVEQIAGVQQSRKAILLCLACS